MIELKAPNQFTEELEDLINSWESNYVSFFLAGSIEMGAAELWQDKVAKALAHRDEVVLFNPRRDDWDSSWVQSIHDKNFNEQVTWEMDKLEESDFIVYYFDPNTKAPITLLELGLHARDGASSHCICVCCPDGFYRKGNVEMVCARFGITLVNTLEEMIAWMNRGEN